jgi:hypothetical protein
MLNTKVSQKLAAKVAESEVKAQQAQQKLDTFVSRQTEKTAALQLAAEVLAKHLQISEEITGAFKHQAQQMANSAKRAAIKAANFKALEGKLARKASKLGEKLQRHVDVATNKPVKGFIISDDEMISTINLLAGRKDDPMAESELPRARSAHKMVLKLRKRHLKADKQQAARI